MPKAATSTLRMPNFQHRKHNQKQVVNVNSGETCPPPTLRKRAHLKNIKNNETSLQRIKCKQRDNLTLPT